MILALDPSSQCIGFAVLTGLRPCDLVDGGLIKPSRALAALGKVPDWYRDHLRQAPLAACWRVKSMMGDVLDLVEEYAPMHIVIEVPSGLMGTGARKGAKGSLTTYGMAAGAVWGRLQAVRPHSVFPVTERMWTPDRGRKLSNQVAMAAMYPSYRAGDDAGADLADAIALARWWIERQEIR